MYLILLLQYYYAGGLYHIRELQLNRGSLLCIRIPSFRYLLWPRYKPFLQVCTLSLYCSTTMQSIYNITKNLT